MKPRRRKLDFHVFLQVERLEDRLVPTGPNPTDPAWLIGTNPNNISLVNQPANLTNGNNQTPSPGNQDQTLATVPINTVGNYSWEPKQTGSTASLALLNCPDHPDVAVKATVDVGMGQYAGLVTRYAGPGDQGMYFGAISDNNGLGYVASIWGNVAGNWTQITPFVTVSGGQGNLDFEISGATLGLFYQARGQNNFTLVGSALETSLTDGMVGYRAGGGAALTNFSIGTPGSASNSLSSANWLNQVGQTALVTNGSGTLAMGQNPLNLATLDVPEPQNLGITATVNVGMGQYAGLVARYAGPGDQGMYFGAISDNNGLGYVASIWGNVAGTWTQITPFVTVSGGQGILDFETSGSTLNLFYQAAGANTFSLVGSAVDTNLTGGRAGFRTSAGASLTNFSTATTGSALSGSSRGSNSNAPANAFSSGGKVKPSSMSFLDPEFSATEGQPCLPSRNVCHFNSLIA